MAASDVATVVLSMVAVIGLIVALVRWFFTRGADEREVSIALRANTESNIRLSTSLDGLTVAFHDFKSSVTERFHDHDIRLTRLEAPFRIDVSATAHRDPGPED